MLRLYTLVLVIFGLLLSTPALAQDRYVTIGTASVKGVYYPAGGAICRQFNPGRKEHGTRCVVESTDGSITNLEGLRKGSLEFGIVQSDLLYYAYRGSEMFSEVGADERLRVVFALHAEPFTVVTRKSAGIRNFDDLKRKHIDLGASGSGTRATMNELMHRKHWTDRTFAGITETRSDEQATALCSGKIDAMIYAGGHPNGAIQQVTSSCSTKIVDVTGDTIENMIKEYPFYTHAVIPGGMYKGNDQDVRTFGMNAVLVASSDLDEEIVYQMTKSVFENLDDFKILHPVFATLNARQMALDTNIAPLHPGALRYYKEKNLITGK